MLQSTPPRIQTYPPLLVRREAGHRSPAGCHGPAQTRNWLGRRDRGTLRGHAGRDRRSLTNISFHPCGVGGWLPDRPTTNGCYTIEEYNDANRRPSRVRGPVQRQGELAAPRELSLS